MAKSLRPRDWAEFIGQPDAVARLKVMVSAAKQEQRQLDHILLTGPPGLGKTTLAGILAGSMGTELVTVTAPALPKPADLASVLIELAGRILFIDEIHRLSLEVEESIYPAIEDWQIDATLELAGSTWSGRVQLEPFTLIGATTLAGNLSQPLRDRFGEIVQLRLYTEAELCQLLERTAGILKVPIDSAGIALIAQRSRGTARIANRLLARVRDYALHHGIEQIEVEPTEAALILYGTDTLGLDDSARSLLRALADAGQPLGLSTLAQLINEAASTIEQALEPYLLRAGLIVRTARGRVITEAGKRHLATL